ncbi:hypothetical protein [Alkalihalobacillus sp. TS-13]|uniref:hypothetical protein n=1 Tax=Alkalihalobacillus sp. TS-13 TaxID=2842455 RepID=UPI001C88C553|nr:hypothetical protein [Alkalihalobacillus sp. TS-13]
MLWDFPLNTGSGQSEGLNIHGIDFFRADPFKHLAREILQNSLDAKVDHIKGPVLVKFNHYRISSSRLPGKDELAHRFELCTKDTELSLKDKKFFEKGKDILSKDKIDLLKISDYQTTGLRGVLENKKEWKRLITKGGDSNKAVGAGGSYGIGKNAPFACSLLNTVYYSTFNIEGERGFQGVSKLASHIKDGSETRGTGYFRKEDFSPITDFNNIDPIFNRDKYGTDVYIAGLKAPEDWKDKVIKAVLDNFFVAIHEGKLEVEVDNQIINKDNLHELIGKYIYQDKNLLTNEFYEALNTDPIILPFEDLGHLEFYIHEALNYSRRVAMVRETGMKIFHLDRFPTGFYFSGVMIARGKELNELLRQTEPPTHDDWQADIHEDTKMASTKLKALKSTIRNKVREISHVDEEESVDLEGLTDFLPDLTNEGNPFGETDQKADETSDKPRGMKLKVRRGKNKLFGSINTPRQRKNPKSKPTPSNPPNPNPTPPDPKPKVPLKINRIRSRGTLEEGTYKVSIYPENKGTGYVQVKVVGEDAKAYNEPLNKVVEQGTDLELQIKNDRIGPLNFEAGIPKTIFVTLQNNMRCSLEVSVHES